MPEICRFYGIIIRMYFGDHAPPHFHAEYAGSEALIRISDAAIVAGSLPPRAYGLVAEWTVLRRNELLSAWEDAQQMKPIDKISPL